ncbi:MAG: hypothetical protein COW58_01860 [Thalassolituus sp. CG17_big_fil_post_rev_8_21_14_2_50_53_8]|nr:MAG: hypothetical protein COW58_01860 [Thalassolituus sp. CG17_big_fil_post_rev_8_21_14_2_50_53_8]
MLAFACGSPGLLSRRVTCAVNTLRSVALGPDVLFQQRTGTLATYFCESQPDSVAEYLLLLIRVQQGLYQFCRSLKIAVSGRLASVKLLILLSVAPQKGAQMIS